MENAVCPGAIIRSEVHAMEFAELARAIGYEARSRGLSVPAFRTPPRISGQTRTVQRFSGGAVVSIAIRGRSLSAVREDMIEGVLCVNKLELDLVKSMRRTLLHALVVETPQAA